MYFCFRSRLFTIAEIQPSHPIKHLLCNEACFSFDRLCALGALGRCLQSGYNEDHAKRFEEFVLHPGANRLLQATVPWNPVSPSIEGPAARPIDPAVARFFSEAEVRQLQRELAPGACSGRGLGNATRKWRRDSALSATINK